MHALKYSTKARRKKTIEEADPHLQQGLPPLSHTEGRQGSCQCFAKWAVTNTSCFSTWVHFKTHHQSHTATFTANTLCLHNHIQMSGHSGTERSSSQLRGEGMEMGSFFKCVIVAKGNNFCANLEITDKVHRTSDTYF